MDLANYDHGNCPEIQMDPARIEAFYRGFDNPISNPMLVEKASLIASNVLPRCCQRF